MSHWTLHHENIYSHPQYNLTSLYSAIPYIGLYNCNVILLHHKNAFFIMTSSWCIGENEICSTALLFDLRC